MAAQLNIGWGKRSIAPDFPVPVTGQFYLRVSMGVRTPVLASALVLENGEDLVVMVSCDMVGIRPRLLTQVQEILKTELPQLPVSKLFISATHTHAGPGGAEVAEFPRNVEMASNEETFSFLARQIAEAVKEAWANRAPGSIAYGYGFAEVGLSRRTVYTDNIGKRENARPGFTVNGNAKMYGNTKDDMFNCYEAGTDPFINLLYTFDSNEKLTGAVINLPCPSQTGMHAWELHASFWHNVREKLSALHGEIGIIAQCAAAGDLSPMQLHYLEAEKRRYALKYPELIARFMADPMKFPVDPDDPGCEEFIAKRNEHFCLEILRAEDMGSRIAAAFEEVLEWASKEKFSAPELRHEIRTIPLKREIFPEEILEEEKKNHQALMNDSMLTEGNKYVQLQHNSTLQSRRRRCGGVVERCALQKEQPTLPAEIHVVKVGNVAFATNRFELFMDYMHRIQARSPFEQTFIVQLTGDPHQAGSYLATKRAQANKGYSASPYCNQVSPEGGQELVEETLKILKEIK